MSNKNIIIGLISLIAIIAIVVVGGPMLSKKPISPEAVPDQPIVEKPPTAAVFETEKVKEKYYSIDLEYPKSSGSKLAEIGEYVNKIRGEFLDFVPKTDEEAEYQGMTEDRSYVLKITTEAYTSSTTVTYKLVAYMFTGGAHGITGIGTFTYDGDGKLITLSDLLSSPDSLAKLSTLSRNYFYEKFGAMGEKKVIDIGTEPKEVNFNTWHLTDRGVTFIFQEYQIGPYTLGTQEFSLTWNEAKGILNLK